MKPFYSLALLAALVAAPVLAQPRHVPAPRGSAPARVQHDDYRDLRRLEDVLSRYDRALSRRQFHEIKRIDGEILGLVRNELRETKQELKQDRRQGDRREVRAGERELRQVRDIAQDYRRLDGRLDSRSVRAKRDMIVELIQMARREVRRG